MSVLDKIVSLFPNKNATTRGVDRNLISILQSNEYKEQIISLRKAPHEEQPQMKLSLPCFTVSGTFSRRCEDGLLVSSGLAAVDLDSVEESDLGHVRNELKKIDCIAYAGLSCRGKRLYCIIPLKFPDKYAQQYERLIRSFTDMGLPMGDECHKAVSQPRFVSWNDSSTQFFNHEAKPFPLLPAPKIYFPKSKNRKLVVSESPPNRFQWCNNQIKKSYEYNVGSRHTYIVQLARYCNIKGLTQEETLAGCLSYVESDFNEAEIKSIVNHIFITQSDSHNKLPYW